MIILGKNKDDKGTQLETITRDILQKMGCKNIQVNFVSSGGEEIDVAADYPLPSVGTTMNRRLICECKAHARPVDLPTWQKFLGMIYSEEARLGNEVSGCFIALSGVNGNVSGHYDELHRTKQNINLVSGDALLAEVTSMHPLCDVETTHSTLEKYTKRQYRALEVAYYNGDLYWIVIFPEDSYTILDSKGSPLETPFLAELKTMIEGALPVRTYVALKEEAEVQRRKTLSMKSVIAQIISNEGKIKTLELKSEAPLSFNESEFQVAVEELVSKGWIAQSTDGSELDFHETDENLFYSNLTYIYRFLFGGEATGFDLLKLLKSPFYSAHINEKFLSQILIIQAGVPLTPEDIEVVIKLLRWSPSAVLWATQADPLIVTHRNALNTSTAEIDHFDRNYFIRRLFESLRHDLSHHVARTYLLDTFNIREIQTQQRVAVKSGERMELKADLNERIGLGYLGEGLTGPDGTTSIIMQMLDSVPEPWEVDAWKQKSTDPEDKPGTQEKTD